MSDLQPQPPARRPSAWLSALMILIGIILLLPGACAGFFVAASVMDPPGFFEDSAIVALWLVCFMVAAGGIALIWLAVRRLRA